MGKVCCLYLRVEPFAALFWALHSIVLTHTWPSPLASLNHGESGKLDSIWEKKRCPHPFSPLYMYLLSGGGRGGNASSVRVEQTLHRCTVCMTLWGNAVQYSTAVKQCQVVGRLIAKIPKQDSKRFSCQMKHFTYLGMINVWVEYNIEWVKNTVTIVGSSKGVGAKNIYL